MKINKLTRDQWINIGNKAKYIQNEIIALEKIAINSVHKRTAQKFVRLEGVFSILKSDLEEEMFTQGIKDTHIFYGDVNREIMDTIQIVIDNHIRTNDIEVKSSQLIGEISSRLHNSPSEYEVCKLLHYMGLTRWQKHGEHYYKLEAK